MVRVLFVFVDLAERFHEHVIGPINAYEFSYSWTIMLEVDTCADSHFEDSAFRIREQSLSISAILVAELSLLVHFIILVGDLIVLVLQKHFLILDIS